MQGDETFISGKANSLSCTKIWFRSESQMSSLAWEASCMYVVLNLRTCDVVRRVNHLSHDPRQCGLRPGGKSEPPRGHGRGVHEHVVHAWDVQRHSWSQHDASLGLGRRKLNERSVFSGNGIESFFSLFDRLFSLLKFGCKSLF